MSDHYRGESYDTHLHHAEDAAALRLELSSLRARQEVLADALAAAGEEMEKLQEWRSRAEIAEMALEDLRAVVRGDTDASTSGPPAEETA